jgi:hypothetical protein
MYWENSTGIQIILHPPDREKEGKRRHNDVHTPTAWSDRETAGSPWPQKRGTRHNPAAEMPFAPMLARLATRAATFFGGADKADDIAASVDLTVKACP